MSELKNRIKADLSTAMKARDELTTSTLRMTIAAIQKAEVAGDEALDLSDSQVVDVVRSEIKKRKASAEAYEQGNRPELAEKEAAEAEILANYLPAAMSDDELNVIVADEVAKLTDPSPKAMGGVIKSVKERAGDGADGARVAAFVKQALAG